LDESVHSLEGRKSAMRPFAKLLLLAIGVSSVV